MNVLATLALAVGASMSTTQDTTLVTASLEIGLTDGAEEYLLGSVSGIAGDRTGRILVSDLQLSRVQVYDSTGSSLQTVGRFGQGPGEMQSLTSIAFLGNDTWACTDIGLDAYLWFDRAGEPITRHRRPRRPHIRDYIRGDGAGGLLDARRGRERSDSVFYVLRIRLTPDGMMRTDSVLIEAIPESFVPLVDAERGFRGGRS